MSEQRSSSTVRSLRSMFENHQNGGQQDPPSPDVRGRPTHANGNGIGAERPISRVRSSFVSVEPSLGHAIPIEIDPEKTKAEFTAGTGNRASTASFRRESFSLDGVQDASAILKLKTTLSGEAESREENLRITEIVPESAIEATPAATTPAVEARDYMAAGSLAKEEREDKEVADAGSKLKEMTLPDDIQNNDTPAAIPADKPDKPVSGAQDDAGAMLPADPKDKALVSGSQPAASTPAAASARPSSPEPQPKPEPEPEAPKTPTTPPRHDTNPAAAVGATESARRGSIIASDVKPKASPVAAAEPPKTPVAARRSPLAFRGSPAVTQSSTASPRATATPGTEKRTTRTPMHTSTASPAAKGKQISQSAPATNANASTASKTTSTAPQKSSPKSPVKTATVSSRLTQPTAASAARKETSQSSKPVASTSTAKTASTTARPPSTTQRHPPTSSSSAGSSTTTRSAPRPSVGRPPSAANKRVEPKPKPAPRAAPDDSFLARMMRPTASSAIKAQERAEVKSPPRRTPSVLRSKPTAPKPRAGKSEATGAASTKDSRSNGAATGPASRKSAAEAPKADNKKEDNEEAGRAGPAEEAKEVNKLPIDDKAVDKLEPTQEAEEQKQGETAGGTDTKEEDIPEAVSTPQPQKNELDAHAGAPADASLEATPAFNAETIR